MKRRKVIDTDKMILSCVSLRKIAMDTLRLYGHESLPAISAFGVLSEAEDVIKRAGLMRQYQAWVNEAGLT